MFSLFSLSSYLNPLSVAKWKASVLKICKQLCVVPLKKSVFNHLHVLIFTEARKTAGGGSSFWIGDVAGLNPDFLSYSLGKQLL